MKKLFSYLSVWEWILWGASLLSIAVAFFAFDRVNYFTFISSLVGVSALTFCAKGHPIGQFLVIIFGIMYAVISFSYSYYGEVITYLGMTAPMAVFALISWLRNPYEKGKSEVKVNRIGWREILLMLLASAAVTVIFYFVLLIFGTENLIPSTISVTTSFIAIYLTARRSPFYAVAYAVNDLVLIVLWILASIEDVSYISVVVCFAVFLINDMYGFFNWMRMQKRQNKA